jgi:hypothetical protein
LERVAERVRVDVAVLLRVRLLVGEAVLPATRLEDEGVVESAREDVALGGREGVAVALA